MAREINAVEFEAEVLDSPVPVLLDVYGEHCPPCRQLAPVIDRLAAQYEGRARVMKIEAGANRELAGRLAISSVPTVLAFLGGQEVSRLVGLRPESAYHKMLGAAGISYLLGAIETGAVALNAPSPEYREKPIPSVGGPQ